MNPILEELEEQIHNYGVEALEFTLENSDNTILVVNDVWIENNKIKVKLVAEHY